MERKPVLLRLKPSQLGVGLACLVMCVGLLAVAPAHAQTYRDGVSGYTFINYYGSGYSNNGYTGAYGGINTPHRSDWINKLNQMRQYEQLVRQNQPKNTAACGFTGAPSYCYRLVTKPRYPAEYRVVRY